MAKSEEVMLEGAPYTAERLDDIANVVRTGMALLFKGRERNAVPAIRRLIGLLDEAEAPESIDDRYLGLLAVAFSQAWSEQRTCHGFRDPRIPSHIAELRASLLHARSDIGKKDKLLGRDEKARLLLFLGALADAVSLAARQLRAAM